MTTCDVVVVGGGPTGLMLACELRLLGVDAVVLEQLREPTGLSKALGIGARAVQTLDYRGLLPRFSAVAGSTAQFARYAHFGGIPLDTSRLGDDRPTWLPVQQARIEALLEARARELGAELRRGHALADLRQDGDAVALDVRGPEGTYALRARFAVGCDGGHSLVRKRAGIAFPGLPPTRLMRLGDVVLPPESLEPGHFVLAGGRRVPFGLGGVVAVPLGDGVYRVVTNEPYPQDFDRDAPMTLDELQASVRRALGDELPVREARWVSRFTDASRLAERYREGRVLLVGDAAHVHLPAGGPGLTTGLQDAVNLGWKLAAEVQGWAPPGLLDSYHAERHPAGRRVLMHTRAAGALIDARDERVAALREVLGQLLADEPALRRVLEMQHAVDTRYEMGGADGAGVEPHPLLGRWAPDLALSTADGPTRVAALMHRARGVLLELGDRAALRDAARAWRDRIDVVAARCEGVPAPAEALLIRPDGYVAWAAPARASEEALAVGLRGALARWFGAGG